MTPTVTCTSVLIPIVGTFNNLINAFTECKRIDFEFKKIEAERSVRLREIEIRQQEMTLAFERENQKLDAAMEKFDKELAMINDELRVSHAYRELLRSQSERVFDCLLDGAISDARRQKMFELWDKIQQQLRDMSEKSQRMINQSINNGLQLCGGGDAKALPFGARECN